MADKFSAQWWNDQAAAAGGLDKAAVESLTGQSFPVVWNTDGTIPWDKAWPKQAELTAPGLAGAGLLLSPTPMPAGYPYPTADLAFAARDPNWGGWARLVTAVGNVAPGTTIAYAPNLSPTYTPPAAELSPLGTAPTTTPTSTKPTTTVLVESSPPETTTSGQTFTGGSPAPGGGGESGAPITLNAAVQQSAAPGSQYAAPTVATPAAGAATALAFGFPAWQVTLAGVAVLLVLAWWYDRRRSR